MRTLVESVIFFVLAMAMVGVAAACGGKQVVTPAEAVARATEAEARKLANETPQDRIDRLRAEQIRVENALKQAQEEKKRLETPEQRQAREEREKAEEQARDREKAVANLLRKVNITGCAGGVVVHPKAYQTSFLAGSEQLVRIVNSSAHPVDIHTGYEGIGTAVQNLCAGGSITLAFSESYTTNKRAVSVELTAVTRVPGVSARERSRTFRLAPPRGLSDKVRESDTWVIR